MAKKMRLLLPPLIFKQPNKDPPVSSPTRHSWVPSCTDHPNTPSFRAPVSNSNDALTQYLGDEAPEELESVVRGVRTMARSSERLFFSPEKTKSILTKTETDQENPISTTIHAEKNSNAPITITMESLDPYTDFRSSMEEMAEAHELRDWDTLEELLGCYLTLNEKRNHQYIIQAFADLVLKSHFAHMIITNNSYSASVCSSPPSNVSDSFVTSFSSPLLNSSTSTTAETSCSSSSVAPAEASRDRGSGDHD